MYETRQLTEYGPRITGVVTSLEAQKVPHAETIATSLNKPTDVYHKWGTLVVIISIPEERGQSATLIRNRVGGVEALFDWIESLPPVPHVDLDAMDRGEIY